MKARALFRRQSFGLVPVSADARKLIADIDEGKTVFVEVWHPRNWAQHRKFFAVLNNVVEATGRWTSTEHLRRDILIALGRFDEHVDQFTGEVHKVPHSMNAASMARADFETLYSDTIRLLTDALGADPEMLLQEAA